MVTPRRSLAFSLALLSLVVLGVSTSIAEETQGGPTEATKFAFIPVLNLAIVAANFVFLVWVFRQDRRERKRERKVSAYFFWIQELILKRHMETINGIFDGYESLLEGIVGRRKSFQEKTLLRKEVMACITEMNRGKQKLTRTVVEDLNIVDKERADTLRALLYSFQDSIYPDLEAFAESRADISPVNSMRKQRTIFLQILYEAHMCPNVADAAFCPDRS